MEPMIQVENLCKRFNTKGGTVEAAKNISFSIEKGEIFGIIGSLRCRQEYSGTMSEPFGKTNIRNSQSQWQKSYGALRKRAS